jgi:hypothetical protein
MLCEPPAEAGGHVLCLGPCHAVIAGGSPPATGALLRGQIVPGENFLYFAVDLFLPGVLYFLESCYDQGEGWVFGSDRAGTVPGRRVSAKAER